MIHTADANHEIIVLSLMKISIQSKIANLQNEFFFCTIVREKFNPNLKTRFNSRLTLTLYMVLLAHRDVLAHAQRYTYIHNRKR